MPGSPSIQNLSKKLVPAGVIPMEIGQNATFGTVSLWQINSGHKFPSKLSVKVRI